MAQTDLSMTFEELRSKLAPLVADALQGADATAGAPESAANTDAAMDRIMLNVQGLIQDQADRPAGCAAAGIPLPEVDQELLPLQTEVEALVGRLSQLRGQVPDLLGEAMTRQLEALRPQLSDDTAASMDQGAAAAEGGEGSCLDLLEGLDLEQLQTTLADTLNKLPGLRARLSAVTSRLQRNVDAVSASQQRAAEGAAPTTVDRVLRAKRRSSSGSGDVAGNRSGEAAGNVGTQAAAGATGKGKGRRKSAAQAGGAVAGEDGTLQRLAEQLGGGGALVAP